MKNISMKKIVTLSLIAILTLGASGSILAQNDPGSLDIFYVTDTTGSPSGPGNTDTTGSPSGPGNTDTTGSPSGPGNTDTTGSGSGFFMLQNPLKVDSVGALISLALELFTYLVVIIAVLALIWVGLQFVLAQGNPDRLKELKNWLLYIVIGVALVIGARIIVSVVINTLDATGTVNPGVIESAREGLR